MASKDLGVLAEMTEAFFNAGEQLLSLANHLEATYKVTPRAYRATQKALQKRKEFTEGKESIEEFFLDDENETKTKDADFDEIEDSDKTEEY